MPSAHNLVFNSTDIFLNSAGGALAAPLPTYTNDQISDFLVYNWLDGAALRWDLTAEIKPTISYSSYGLSSEAQSLISMALSGWAMVTGFGVEHALAGAGAILFEDSQPGAFAGPVDWTGPGGTIYKSRVNVSQSWIDTYGTTFDSYSYQTFMHEIGHAIGLGHAGNYNGTATYATDGSGDNHYLNDSWQTSVMSYFDQSEAGIGPSYFLLTPMIADILAIWELYGRNLDLRVEDNTYANGSFYGGYWDTNFRLVLVLQLSTKVELILSISRQIRLPKPST